MSRPRLLDLYCGAGGAAMGYHRAGFEIVGVDNRPQPRYPFRFWQMDALELEPWAIQAFDAVHASPPCKAYSVSRNNGNEVAAETPKLIAETRELLEASGRPWIMENVVGARAAMRPTVELCGASLGLLILGFDVPRHRLFEASFVLLAPPCSHRRGQTMGVYGHGVNQWHRELLGRSLTVDEQREALEIPWMIRDELSQAIPPVYTELLGVQLLAQVDRAASSSPTCIPRLSELSDGARMVKTLASPASDPGSSPGGCLTPSVADGRSDHTRSHDLRQ